MRQIRKRSEPGFWRDFRKEKGAVYGITWMPKQELREALAREQGYLCCYCMERIDPSEKGMKVEHWESQSEHGSRQIDYDNLLGACTGGEGRPHDEQHCDTHKRSAALHTNPASPDQDCSRLFRYLSDGSIAATSAGATEDISTLNLNLERLKLRRKAVLDALGSWAQRQFPGQQVDPEIARKMAQEKAQPDREGKLEPFCQVAIHWLEKRARRS